MVSRTIVIPEARGALIASNTNSQLLDLNALRQKISLANGAKGASQRDISPPRPRYKQHNTRTKHNIIFFTSITSNDIMYVVKRDGKQQTVQFDKIQSRISKLCYGLDQKVRMILVVVLVGPAVGIATVDGTVYPKNVYYHT
jgi:hypothetical protein